MDLSKISQPSPDNLAQAAEFLRRGDLVGVPTETVYGLAANATSCEAVAKIYAAKERPPSNPLIVHVASADEAVKWSDVESTPWMRRQFDIAAGFWPGPLTVIAPTNKDRSRSIAKNATAGGETVGLRVPDHPVVLALLRQCEFPLAAPSANRSNYISPTTAQHVASGLGDRVSMILDGGPCSCGVESTIIKLDSQGPKLLRAGGLCISDLEAAFGQPIENIAFSVKSNTDATGDEHIPMPAPGQFQKHYSPTKPLWINGYDPISIAASKIGRLVFRTISDTEAAKFRQVWTLSKDGNLDEVARNLFAVLREADQSDVTAIVIDACDEAGIGSAIMDRICRAASE